MTTLMTAIRQDTLGGSDVLRPVIAETFLLADAAKAHELGEGNRTAGKIVLTLGKAT